jgi:hypothetical protein
LLALELLDLGLLPADCDLLSCQHAGLVIVQPAIVLAWTTEKVS